MTSKQKSITAGAYKEKHHYSLRPLKDISKNKRFNHAKTHTKKWSTSVPATNRKLPKKGPQMSANSSMELIDLIGDADLTALSDMEHDAFQLAEYVGSNSTIYEILNETQKTNVPITTSSNPCDLRTENNSMNSSLDELLDISIEELQKAAHQHNANTANVAFRTSTPNQPTTPRNIVANNDNSGIENGASKRVNYNGTGSGVLTDYSGRPQISRRMTENPFKRQPNIWATEPLTFGDHTQQISVHGRPKPVGSNAHAHKAAVEERLFSTSVASGSSSKDTPYTTWTKNVALKQKVTHLFNRPCYNYLNGRCCGNVCKWNHGLPHAREVYQKLMQLSDKTVKYVYSNFVLINHLAFETYFASMCEVFGKRKMKSVLVVAIGDCGKREKVEFLTEAPTFIYFTGGNGSSKRDALTTVANNCCKTKDCYDVLLEIIIETDALYFVDKLEEYHLYGTISTASMSKLLQQTVDAPDTALVPVFIDILDKYSMYSDFDEETFKSFVPRVKKLVMGNLSLAQRVSHIVKRMH